MITGPNFDLAEIFSVLNERSLLLLIQDVLTVGGHTEVKLMDGPGDGKRDLHSVDPDGEKHLVQSKFTRKVSQNCPPRLLEELPQGMLKLGYSRGLFVTTGKISPQAKREYLDSYPTMRLDFLDGLALYRTVLGSPLLKALWVDGDKIVQSNFSVTIPVLLREVRRGATPIFQTDLDDPICLAIRTSISAHYPSLGVKVEIKRVEAALFAPYRPPRDCSVQEGWLNNCVAIVYKLDNVSLSSLDEIRERIVSDTAGALTLESGSILAVRIGQSNLVPLGGGLAGDTIAIGCSAFTVILCDGEKYWEEDFFAIDNLAHWSPQCDARMSELRHVRLFSAVQNALLQVIHRGPLSHKESARVRAERELVQRAWQQSLFLELRPSDIEVVNGIMGREADDTFKAAPSNELAIACWLSPPLHNGWLGFANGDPEIDRELVSADIPFPQSVIGKGIRSPSDMTVEWARYSKAKALALTIFGSASVNCEKARHLCAAFLYDPYPSLVSIERGIPELIDAFGGIPSPIDPEDFLYFAFLAWEVTGEFTDSLCKQFSTAGGAGNWRLELDKSEIGRYLVLDSELQPNSRYLPMESLVENLGAQLSHLANSVEATARSLGVGLVRATRAYWAAKTNVTFAPDGTTKGKTMMEFARENGTIERITYNAGLGTIEKPDLSERA